MNPSASLTASSVVFNTGSENFGAITAAVTFNDGSANSGTVTGNAAFNGAAINRAAGTISGNAVFSDTSVNAGTVTGDATIAESATNAGTVSGTVTVGGGGSGGGQSDEGNYQEWLAANSGVNQYSGAGSHNGQWAYNSTEYGSQANAQAAYDAEQLTLDTAAQAAGLTGQGNGTTGRAGVFYYHGSANGADWTFGTWFFDIIAKLVDFSGITLDQYRAIPSTQFATNVNTGLWDIIGDILSLNPSSVVFSPSQWLAGVGQFTNYNGVYLAFIGSSHPVALNLDGTPYSGTILVDSYTDENGDTQYNYWPGSGVTRTFVNGR